MIMSPMPLTCDKLWIDQLVVLRSSSMRENSSGAICAHRGRLEPNFCLILLGRDSPCPLSQNSLRSHEKVHKLDSTGLQI